MGTVCSTAFRSVRWVLATGMLTACSYQSLYESSVSQRVEACRELRTEEREICERRARRPYPEYAQEREQALEDDH